ncbi:hypothetical protein H0H81_008634 [Sphagnurus paluster]|uniref:Glycosyltransferase 2-like domain-containing protein n=1 Tax=Sphagnurus paluster TaxID=117069 RepID=A0A9P7K4U5_9AGAR|nr:hypothetical protein H0H81_008634 [Sphagnurus paluster]
MSAITLHNSDYDLFDAWLHKIYESTQTDNWFMPSEDVVSTGVCLRADNGFFRVFPYENASLVPFEAAVRGLNPVAAVKLRNTAVVAALAKIGPKENSIYIDQSTRIQVLESIDYLPQAEKDQCGAFIRDEGALVLWSYSLEGMIPLCRDFDQKLIKHIWRTRRVTRHSSSTSNENGNENSPAGSSQEELVDEKSKEKAAEPSAAPTTKTAEKPSKWWNWRLQRQSVEAAPTSEGGDLEKGGSRATKGNERKLVLLGPLYAGCGAGLAAYFMTSGISILMKEYALDGDPRRFALIVTLPVIFCVSLFFCLQLVGNLSLILGPVAQYHENSMYYSAIKPAPNPEIDNNLPHITIQLPVYKESLELTIGPSVFSIKKAMQTYARQGGTSAIFICDDGLQLISEEDRKERLAFYANHNIGWVARPGHDSKEGGFKRAGKFKKASNMNYGLALSLKLEKHLARLIAEGAPEGTGEDCLEDQAMRLAAEEIYEETGRKWKPWCANGKSMRVGEIILIIDSDTIVPEDCFRDAAREMGESPDVAIIQHESDVMQVANHYFENGITHFTRRINRCISLGCANGEVAPFVGHNAFLRWSAVQDAAFVDPADGKLKQWSEANVSEDFDLALRLLLKGYTLRWATYSNGGFKEGVSLTVVDELARWQKYAYGCNEIIFNPLIKWWNCGPISPQLRGFVWSKAPVHYKIGMMSYGIAAATVGSILNYLLLGLAPQLDRFYLHSFEILLACTVVFPGIGNLGFTLLEYRLGHRNFIGAMVENLRWVPFFLVMQDVGIHRQGSRALHLLDRRSVPSPYLSSLTRTDAHAVPRIWERFKLSFIICFLCIIMMAVFASDAVPFEYQIAGWNWALVIPLSLCVGCHILLPVSWSSSTMHSVHPSDSWRL